MRVILAILFSLFLQLSWAIDASISYATFSGEKSNYIELYLYIVGSTLDHVEIDSSNMQANVEVTIIFNQDDKIIKFDKYELKGPIAGSKSDFIDLKRYNLENGSYSVDLTIVDLNDPDNFNDYSLEKVIVDYDNAKIYISDIQLLSAYEESKEESQFVKNGIYMESAPFNFYNKNLETLYFYTEIYGIKEHHNEDYLLSYFIDPISSLSNGRSAVIGHKRRQAKAKDVLLIPIDIKDLASGNYKLRVEVRDREKKLICAKATLFQRSNPFAEVQHIEDPDFDLSKTFVSSMVHDELRYSLKAIAPKMSGADVEVLNMVIENKDVKPMKTQLFTYWANKNPINPEEAYLKYMEVAKAVDVKFNSGFGYGFESDRGYTFMRYGKPTNMISITDEPDAPPYEIWFYDNFPFTNQTDVKFLFYNPSLAAGDYRLLHSNARGEINNPQWLVELYRDSPDGVDGDERRGATGVVDGFSRNASRYFNDF